MPQQRVVVGYRKSSEGETEHETKLPKMDKPLAQQVKRDLDPTKDGTVIRVRLEDVPDSEPE